jgi:hypothetical protein
MCHACFPEPCPSQCARLSQHSVSQLVRTFSINSKHLSVTIRRPCSSVSHDLAAQSTVLSEVSEVSEVSEDQTPHLTLRLKSLPTSSSLQTPQEAATVRLRPLEERDVTQVTQMLVDYQHHEADPIKDLRGLSDADTHEYYHTMASHPENRAFSVVAVVGGGSEAGRSGEGTEEIVSFLLALPFETMYELEQAYHPKGDWRVDDAVWTGLFEDFKRYALERAAL